VDGGKTWHDATAYNGELVSASNAHLNGVTSRIGVSLGTDSVANAVYQGTLNLPDPTAVKGISVDLSAYAGQTVNVIFAAVSASDTSTLCVLHYITNISVSAQ
jgi:hypothetical protein